MQLRMLNHVSQPMPEGKHEVFDAWRSTTTCGASRCEKAISKRSGPAEGKLRRAHTAHALPSHVLAGSYGLLGPPSHWVSGLTSPLH